MNLTTFTETFARLYGSKPLVVRSPGRVNIIGEHTDYNNGFVLPAAIDKAVYVGVAPSTDTKIRLYALEFNAAFEADINELNPVDAGWPNYILGVVAQLRKRGLNLTGFDLLIDGDVPFGAGMSSSAAVECAVAYSLNELFALGLSKLEMVKMAQAAEHEFAGVKCGIMDQFASMFGKEGYVIKLDCATLDFEYVPLQLEGYRLVLMNTNVKHSLASSAYNQRRQECERGVQLIAEKYSSVSSLRDADLNMLRECVEAFDPVVFRRCKYVVEEKQRLLDACEALQDGDIPRLGALMFQTHNGLSTEFEVSCPELDFLVSAVSDDEAVLGARMMGGGFGGCTINIIRETEIERVTERVAKDYEAAMKLPLTCYTVDVQDGTSVVAHR